MYATKKMGEAKKITFENLEFYLCYVLFCDLIQDSLKVKRSIRTNLLIKQSIRIEQSYEEFYSINFCIYLKFLLVLYK